jgi:hypothetical protein
MLTDFFTASPAEVQALDIAQSPAATVRCLRAQRADPIKIVQLQCSIDGAPFAVHEPLLDTMLVRQAADEGPWFFRLPEVIESQLAAASPAELNRIGKSWAATEEWTRDGGTPETIIPLVTAIAQFAVEARSQKRSVYIWMSL